jgi:hypothetical protein
VLSNANLDLAQASLPEPALSNATEHRAEHEQSLPNHCLMDEENVTERRFWLETFSEE